MISRCEEKKSRCSGTTILLQRWTSTTKAFKPEPTRYSENYTRCSECFLFQIAKHIFQSMHHYSSSVSTRCSEFQSHCSEFTQHHSSTNPNLLIAARSNLATASAHCFKHFSPQNHNFFSMKSTYHKLCFAVDIKLHLSYSRKSLSLACEMLHIVGIIDSFLQLSTKRFNYQYPCTHHDQHLRLHLSY